MTLEYKQSLSELNTILNYMDLEYINKLPNKLTQFIKNNMDKFYVNNININIPINYQPLKEDTKALLSIIYRNYWCSEEKKIVLAKEDEFILKEHERIIKERYNPENIFKKRSQKSEMEENVAQNQIFLIDYKETFFKKVINRIKSIFHIN